MARNVHGWDSVGDLMVSHDRRFLETLSRTTVWLDRGETRRLEQGFARFEAWRSSPRRSSNATSWTAASRARTSGCTAASRRGASATCGVCASSPPCASSARRSERPATSARRGRRHALRSSCHRGRGRGHGTKCWCRASRRSCAATASASSAPTERARRAAQPAHGATRPTPATCASAPTCRSRRSTSGDELRPDWTVADALTGGRGDQVVINGKARHVASYMKDFPVPARAGALAAVGAVGRRASEARVARALAKPSNLLVLDEPTKTSTWRRSTCCRNCSPTTPAPCCSSATTATSSTAS